MMPAFFEYALDRQRGGNAFEVVGQRLVRVEVDGFVWIKRGTVIAYQGDLRFRPEDVFQSEAIGWKGGPISERSRLDAARSHVTKSLGSSIAKILA